MRTESLRDFTVLETVYKDEGRMTVRECDWQGHRMVSLRVVLLLSRLNAPIGSSTKPCPSISSAVAAQ